MNKQELLDFFRYLERRGFLREDLQCNPEHHVMVYLRDFYNKPTETQGLDPDEIFEYVGDFQEGFALVKLNGKYNFINQECKLVSDQWFDNAWEFREGFAKVKLNDMVYNLDMEGDLHEV